jgi:hypothetical protein
MAMAEDRSEPLQCEHCVAVYDYCYKCDLETTAAIGANDRLLRKLLFLRHGCSFDSLYGDDGEMQCNKCLIDFKRFSAKEIEDRFTQIGIEVLAKEFK